MSDKNPWKTLKIKEVYDNPWINVKEHEVVTPGNTKGIYGVVHFKNLAIGIIPIDNDGNTYIVGQYRYPHKKYSWEIIEGGGTINVNPVESAKRELLEEAGIKAQKWTKILEIDLSNSATDEHAIIYVAQGLTFHKSSPEDTEDLVIKKIPFQDFFSEIYQGKHQDSLTVSGVLKAQLMLENEELKID
jgi:8-oxo-dGTP pyrophosphatase MutT (NUDIX family)